MQGQGGGSLGGRMSPGVTLPPATTATGRMEDPGPDNPTMDLGIHLLERGQYASAREVFLRLQVAQPNDARVWYLSALAEGLTGGDWDGAAKRLAEKGLECERAGHPSTARIDAALATRTPIKGEDWIASLRRRVLSVRNNDAK
jgi:predicted Zn-dependent protease